MLKYVIYLAAAALILWSVIYLLISLRRQWTGRRGCGSGCDGCPKSCRRRHSKE